MPRGLSAPSGKRNLFFSFCRAAWRAKASQERPFCFAQPRAFLFTPDLPVLARAPSSDTSRRALAAFFLPELHPRIRAGVFWPSGSGPCSGALRVRELGIGVQKASFGLRFFGSLPLFSCI